MSLVLAAEALPSIADADGAVRVATCVTLDAIVAVFQDELTAEKIADKNPSLPLD